MQDACRVSSVSRARVLSLAGAVATRRIRSVAIRDAHGVLILTLTIDRPS